MSEFILGKDLIKRWEIEPFELIDYVKRGLQPYDQNGKPKLPKYVKDAIQMLENNVRIIGEAQTRQSFLDRSIEIAAIVKDWRKRNQSVEECKNKLMKNPSAVWENFNLPEDEKKAEVEIKILVNSYYKRDQAKAFKKKIKISDKKKKSRPDQLHKIECQRVAKQLWEKNPNRTIADIIQSDEINQVTAPKVYAEKTIRNWIKESCPNRRPGRRPK